MRVTRLVCLIFVASATWASPALAAEIDPGIASYVLPKDIPWKTNAAGTNQQAVLYGDPAKPGLYIVRVKWLPGNMSRPHFHPNDRLIVVLSGTWWVGTGDKYDPDNTVPMPAGTYVTHYAGKIHYDGAKDGETIIEVHGMGPATSTPAPPAR
jgi:predicted metal-dependent enzyme (double-stranded beta helix superfamily)